MRRMSRNRSGVAGFFEEIPVLIIVLIGLFLFLASFAHSYGAYVATQKSIATRELGYDFSNNLRIWYGLLDDMRIHLERKKLAKFTSIDGMKDGDGDGTSFDPQSPADFNLEEFLADLSLPAQLAARMLFEPCPAIDGKVRAKGGSPAKWRSAIRNEMHASGYSRARINEAFLEIERALKP